MLGRKKGRPKSEGINNKVEFSQKRTGATPCLQASQDTVQGITISYQYGKGAR